MLHSILCNSHCWAKTKPRTWRPTWVAIYAWQRPTFLTTTCCHWRRMLGRIWIRKREAMPVTSVVVVPNCGILTSAWDICAFISLFLNEGVSLTFCLEIPKEEDGFLCAPCSHILIWYLGRMSYFTIFKFYWDTFVWNDELTWKKRADTQLGLQRPKAMP